MASNESQISSFAEFQKLAAESPRDARRHLNALLDSGAELLDTILRLATAPSEGRLRQLIANTVRHRKDKARVVPYLLHWRDTETDEFAKAAIAAALADVGPTVSHSSQAPDLPQLVETYRYVANRLCHRVRNSLTSPAQHLRSLETVLNGAIDAKSLEAKDAVGKLKNALRELSRIVEFDIDDSYFQWKSVDLPAWLRSMTTQYSAKNSRVALRITGPAKDEEVRIQANDLLLETLFWNLWKNAQQVVESPCEIGAHFSISDPNVDILITDNGQGFSAEDAELAFVDRFARRGANFGRGLLEVHDAVQRLGGTVQLVQIAGDVYRPKLTFPLTKL